MLTLNISQQYAKISINTNRADMGLTSTRPRLNIETEPEIVEISQPKGELEIDWEPFRASYGIKNNDQFARDCAELGRKTAFETIGRFSEEGDRMARIESKQDPMITMATESSSPPTPEVIWARLEPPVIHYTAHQPKYNPIRGHVDTNLIRGKVDMNFKPAQIDIRMTQYPNVKMWVTDNSVDISA